MTMMRNPWTLCVAVAIATASSYAIEYLGGLHGRPLSLGPLPAQAGSFLLTIVCLASLFAVLVIDLAKSRPAREPIAALALAFSFAIVGFAFSPAKVFQAGFRRGILSTVSPDELRGLARACHRVLPVDASLPGPRKYSLWHESAHRTPWNDLVGSTALGKLDPSLTIHHGADTVTLSWGGALVGHWGLTIQTDGKTGMGDIAEGIGTFVSPD